MLLKTGTGSDRHVKNPARYWGRDVPVPLFSTRCHHCPPPTDEIMRNHLPAASRRAGKACTPTSDPPLSRIARFSDKSINTYVHSLNVVRRGCQLKNPPILGREDFSPCETWCSTNPNWWDRMKQRTRQGRSALRRFCDSPLPGKWVALEFGARFATVLRDLQPARA